MNLKTNSISPVTVAFLSLALSSGSVIGQPTRPKYATEIPAAVTGPDKGKGGKFLIIPLGYEGEIPEGYHVARTNTYGNWVIWRGFQVDGSTKPAVDATKKNFRI